MKPFLTFPGRPGVSSPSSPSSFVHMSSILGMVLNPNGLHVSAPQYNLSLGRERRLFWQMMQLAVQSAMTTGETGTQITVFFWYFPYI